MAVSYTHLDVYKRQLLKCPHELNREDADSWIASLGLGDHCLRNHLEQLEIEVGRYRCTLTRDGSRSVHMEYNDQLCIRDRYEKKGKSPVAPVVNVRRYTM